MSRTLRIAGREIGPEHPPYVIAELSANHNQRLDRAIALVEAAALAGADAIKLQHYTPETITVRSERPEFAVRGGTLWDGRQLADLYAEAMTPWEWTDAIAAAADRSGLAWLSTPFDHTAVAFLDGCDAPALKIASFELVDLPLIRRAAATGRPLVLSTGMATVEEIDAAVDAAIEAGGTQLALLRCNSAYPARAEEMDLRSITAMAGRWDVPVGLSDHTLGTTAATVAVALGACIIEKHLTGSRLDGGPDAAFSAEPHELAELVRAVREAHAALGTCRFGPSEHERASLAFRRSLRAVRPIRPGEPLTADNVRSVRPAGGLAPDALDAVLGRRAAIELEVGAPISWEVLT
ncbi:MAG: pseudaminic acid synthase [Acidimicrobiia bacterium]